MKDSQHGDELILVKAREGASQQRHSDKDVERSCLTSLCIANPVARCTGLFNRKARTLSNRCEDEREMVRVVADEWSGTGSPGAESARGTVVGRPSGLPTLGQAARRLRNIQAVFSCTCMRWVSRSAVGSSLTFSSKGKMPRAVRTTASWPWTRS